MKRLFETMSIPMDNKAMRTEAQKKAERNYRKKIKQIILRYYPNEMKDYQKAKDLGSRAIKELIKENV